MEVGGGVSDGFQLWRDQTQTLVLRWVGSVRSYVE